MNILQVFRNILVAQKDLLAYIQDNMKYHFMDGLLVAYHRKGKKFSSRLWRGNACLCNVMFPASKGFLYKID